MSDESIYQFVNSEVKTKGGEAEPLDVTIGKKSDSAGNASGSSIFSWVKFISAHLTVNLTSERAAKIDTIDSKVGANSDAAGTSTVFARLRQIYEHLTTNLPAARASLLDKLDTGGIPGTIKGIQRGTGQFSGGWGGTDTGTSATVNISQVNINKSYLILSHRGGVVTQGTGWDNIPISSTLQGDIVANGTQIALSMGWVSGLLRYEVNYSWQVIEHY